MALDRRASPLTERQREVLSLVARGRSNREIGADLGITEDGVKAHLSRLFLRFGVTNRVELLAAARTSAAGDRANSEIVALGELRAIAGRANANLGAMHGNGADGSNGTNGHGNPVAQLRAVRDALAAVDLALDLVHELPPDTTGPLVAALRKRVTVALDALDMVEGGIQTTA